MSRIPMSARGRRPAFFEDKAIDSLVTMVLELSTELWVLKERQAGLESVLSDKMPALLEALEAWEPAGEQRAALDAERQRFLQAILRTLDADFTSRSDIQRERDAFIAETIAEGTSGAGR